MADIAMGDVFAALGRQWLVMAVVFGAILLIAILYLRAADRSYTSVLLLTPVASGGGTPSRLGGLASLAGIRVPGSDAQSQFDLFVEGLTTRESAERLVKSHPNLLPRMFPGEWDPASKSWREPQGTVVSIIAGVKSLTGSERPYAPPDAARVQRWLLAEIGIERARDLQLTTIFIQTRDQELGRDILAALHSGVDEFLRRRAIERADDYIAYLNEKLFVVTVADYRQALVETLSEQEKTRMMASSDLPFAAEPFGPPTTSDKPTSPNPLVILMAAIGVGLALAIAIALLRERRRLFGARAA